MDSTRGRGFLKPMWTSEVWWLDRGKSRRTRKHRRPMRMRGKHTVPLFAVAHTYGDVNHGHSPGSVNKLANESHYICSDRIISSPFSTSKLRFFVSGSNKPALRRTGREGWLVFAQARTQNEITNTASRNTQTEMEVATFKARKFRELLVSCRSIWVTLGGLVLIKGFRSGEASSRD